MTIEQTLAIFDARMDALCERGERGEIEVTSELVQFDFEMMAHDLDLSAAESEEALREMETEDRVRVLLWPSEAQRGLGVLLRTQKVGA